MAYIDGTLSDASKRAKKYLGGDVSDWAKEAAKKLMEEK